MMKSRSIALLMFGLLLVSAAPGAELRWHKHYADNMVLQRDQPVLVKGWADAGAEVTVTFGEQRKRATAGKDGAWTVTLDPMPANAKPHELAVTSSAGNLKSSIGNILVGDVLVVGFQSCIDISLGSTEAGKTAARAYQPNANLRTLRIKPVPAMDPQLDIDAKAVTGWGTVDGARALGMTATAFYLGRDLAEKVNVPIGIVDIAMAPHFATSWLSEAALDESELRGTVSGDLGWFRKHMPEDAKKWAEAEAAAGGTGGKSAFDLSPLELPYYPSACYNAVLHPLQGLAVKGVLIQLGNDYPLVTYSALQAADKITNREGLNRAWVQGYLVIKNANRMTPDTLPYVPADLRRSFADPTLPIGWIMPPGSDLFDYAVHNREIRELQRRTQAASEGVSLIMPGTEHVPLSGQPADAQLLAARCLQWVLGAVYLDKDAVSSGPVFERFEAGPNTATITFKEGTANGLKADRDALDQFEVAGPDGAFVSCKAKIDGQTIRLASDKVYAIHAIRYNWSLKPDQGLVNSANLPALPFTTEPGWQYNWWPPNPPVELSVEYRTTANTWPERDVALINGANRLTGGDSQPNPNDLGPTGIQAAPFGPNLYVHRILPGTPADGKLMPDDIIFGVNGEEFGLRADDKYRQFSAGITHAESEAGDGRLVLGVRRKGRNISVELTLEVLGSYSATTPYSCPKSDKLVQRAEAWMNRRFRRTDGGMTDGIPHYHYHGDELFLLASGTPEHQGLVRRVIYAEMAKNAPERMGGNINWWLGYDALLLGEYYHRTGDPNVLAHLEALANRSAATQIQPPDADPAKYAVATTDEQVGGWRSKFQPGIGRTDYGLMAAAGMACVMGMQLAKEAGLDIDEVALQRGIRHFNQGRAEYGYVEYAYRNLRIAAPKPVDPEAEDNGMAQSMNGKLGTAAALFSMLDEYGTAVDSCSRSCVYAFNRTRSGHGGMFFNNWWTPIGAHAAGEKGFRHFMQGQTWWRELYRRNDGSFTQAGRGGIGVAYAIHYVAPKKNLRMLGAPRSVFGSHSPAYLKPALEAYRKRDYALAEKLTRKAMEETIISAADRPVVDHFLDSVKTVRESVDHDLAYTEELLRQDKHYYASFELPQLKGVVAADNPRLRAIVAALESPEGREKIRESQRAGMQALQDRTGEETVENEAVEEEAAGKEDSVAIEDSQKEAEINRGEWVCLVTKFGLPRGRTPLDKGEVPEAEASRWRMMVLETPKHAPEGWAGPTFDDSGWHETTLPISWRVSHTALFRTTFTVDDKDAFDALRFRGNLPQQQNIEIYINGELVAKIDNVTGWEIKGMLTDYARQITRNGENTLAVITQHQKRWGKVKNNRGTILPFSVMIDARKRE